MLSVVIPAFNEEGYIEKLLMDLERQTYEDFEVIVSDASSTDRTADIARSFGCEVVTTEGKGPAHERNMGSKDADGDYLLFLDADVRLKDRTFLEDLMDEVMSGNIRLATTVYEFDDGRNIDSLLSRFIMNNIVNRLSNILSMSPGCILLVKKEVHEEIGGFDESVVLGEDHDYIRRATELVDFNVIDDLIVSVSGRRFREEGRLDVYSTYLYTTVYRWLNGEMRKDIRGFEFGKF